jgi:WD40 repeat protein
LALIPDSNFFLVGCSFDIVLLPLADDKGSTLGKKNKFPPRLSFSGHSAAVRCLAVSTDGECFVSGSNDRNLILWSLAVEPLNDSDSDQFLKLTNPLRVFRGHTSMVFSVSMSVDASRLVSGSADGTLRIWDIKSGNSLSVLDAKPIIQSPIPWLYGCTFFGEFPAFLKSNTAGYDSLGPTNFCLAGGGTSIMIWDTIRSSLFRYIPVTDSEKITSVCLLGGSRAACGACLVYLSIFRCIYLSI